MSRNVPVPFELAYDLAEFDARSNRWALELQLEEMAQRDDFRPTDAATIAAARNLATAVDLDFTNAALWRQYRDALEALKKHGDDDGGSPDVDVLAAIRNAPTPTAT